MSPLPSSRGGETPHRIQQLNEGYDDLVQRFNTTARRLNIMMGDKDALAASPVVVLREIVNNMPDNFKVGWGFRPRGSAGGFRPPTTRACASKFETPRDRRAGNVSFRMHKVP